jgi:hypothetical protein
LKKSRNQKSARLEPILDFGGNRGSVSFAVANYVAIFGLEQRIEKLKSSVIVDLSFRTSGRALGAY